FVWRQPDSEDARRAFERSPCGVAGGSGRKRLYAALVFLHGGMRKRRRWHGRSGFMGGWGNKTRIKVM
ncbi:MAG: hypothetical protein Q4F11_10470, partial [Eubacteriales bacterium]|nr:hypothetical protein [Eubacteriales bacterium]